MPKKIIVCVGADGQGVSVEVDGWVGPGCQNLTANLEAALGKVIDKQAKAEFYQRPAMQEESLRQGEP